MNEGMTEAAAREIAQCYEDIRKKDAEIERLTEVKDLLIRAADAMEQLHKYAPIKYSSLIKELREAVK